MRLELLYEPENQTNPVLHEIIIVQIIFSGPLKSLSLFIVILKIEFCLSRCCGWGGGGVFAGVAHFMTDHEQTQLDRVNYFHFFGVFLASNGPTYSELIVLESIVIVALLGL